MIRPPLPSDHLTTAEAALILGVGRGRVARFARDGRLPGAVRRGRPWLLPVAEVERLAAIPRSAGNPNFLRRKPLVLKELGLD